MSQVADFNIPSSPLNMAALKAKLQAVFAALGTCNRGPTAPSNPEPGRSWLDNSVTNEESLKTYTTAGWITLLTINVSTGVVSLPSVTAYIKNVNAGAGISVDKSDPNNPVVSANGVAAIVAGAGMTVDNSDPKNPVVASTRVASVGAGTNIAVNNSDPKNPVVSAPNVAVNNLAQTFSGGQRSSSTSVSSASGTLTLDLSQNNDFSVTLTENTVLANPTNMVAGQKGRIFVTNGSTAYTISYGSYWKAPGGNPLAVTATAGAKDLLYYDVISLTQIAYNLVKGLP